MADEDERIEQVGDNDEYQFADLDGLGTESAEPLFDESEGASDEGVAASPDRGRIDPQMMKTIKHGLFAIGGLILFLLIYKFVASFLSPAATTLSTNKKTTAAITTPKIDPIATTPTPMTMSTPVQVSDRALKDTDRKVDALERERTRLNADVLLMHQQLRDVTQSVSDMTASINDIKQSMLTMSEKMEQQSERMIRLQATQHAKKRATSSAARTKAVKTKRTRYVIQAIIPGRAWLMSSTGETLTVSRGSSVPGYGDVRLINPKLGRVFTSSGRVIQFSQADS